MSPSSSQQAAVLYGPRDIRMDERPVWAPTQGQATVAVQATGLCGSDLHYYTHGRNGDFAVRAPLVLGHEAAGIVTAVAADVVHLKVGQRVAIEAGISCRECAYCDSGRYNLCKGMRFCSSAARYPHVDGSLQAHMNHPAHVLHPLPDDVPTELAALAEPLSVLIHAGRRVQLGSVPNESVLVFGVGAIGLLACALARHRGAARVVAVDINPQRLDFARRHGYADAVYCLPAPTPAAAAAPPSEPCCSVARSTPSSSSSSHSHPSAPSPDQVLAKAQATAAQLLASFAQPDGFDVVFECTGAESAVQMSVYAATAGGRVMLVGMGTRAAYMPVAAFALREVDIRGSFRYANTYAEALELLRPTAPATTPDGARRKTLPELVALLVTHRFPLSQTSRAFEMLARGTDDAGGLVLKVIVEGPAVDA